MATISVLPGAAGSGFRAVSGGHLCVGDTIGEALDGLSAELGSPTETTLVVVQPMKPDSHFTADQQQRLGELMTNWRAARDAGRSLPPHEQAELDGLIAAEVNATTARAGELLSRLSS